MGACTHTHLIYKIFGRNVSGATRPATGFLTMMILFEILLLVGGLFLIVAVLLQHGKSHGLSGSIAGGAETFFGKEKGSRIDARLSKLTGIVGGVFLVIAFVVYIIQPSYTAKYSYDNLPSWQYLSSYYDATANVEETTSADTTADTTAAE